MEIRKCWKCKEDKLLTSDLFYREFDGFQKACKECQKKRNKEYSSENSEYFAKKGKEKYKREDNHARYLKTRDKYLERKDIWSKSIKGRLYDLLEAARDRSRKKELLIDIDLDYLIFLYQIQEQKCSLTDIPFVLERNSPGKRGFKPFGPSIDRIDCSKGYTKDNVRLVCVIVNLSLNNFGDECFDKMCEAYIAKKKRVIPNLSI